MTVPGRALFAVWLCAVTAGGSVVHHRAAADAGHTHGFGLANLPGRADGPGATGAHCHLVLLGVELGATPDDTACGDGTVTRCVPDTTAAVELAGLDHSAAVPVAFLAAPAAVTPVATACGDASRPMPPDCPLTTLARSGVLRS